MRKIRAYAVGIIVGGLLMLGGQALADIPDSQPSVVDPSHTVFLCYQSTSARIKPVVLLDKSLGNCPVNYPNQVTVAPVVQEPQTP